MTTPDDSSLALSVAQAIAEIRAHFADQRIEVWPDGDGGAFVRIHDIASGPSFTPALIWVGFRITFQYPHADIYPHFLPSTFARKNGQPLGEAIHAGREWQPTGATSEPAVMVSRRSSRLNPATDTALFKLLKVIAWLHSR